MTSVASVHLIQQVLSLQKHKKGIVHQQKCMPLCLPFMRYEHEESCPHGSIFLLFFTQIMGRLIHYEVDRSLIKLFSFELPPFSQIFECFYTSMCYSPMSTLLWKVLGKIFGK